MANRPVFCTKTSSPYFSVESVSFSYNPGFSFSQKQNNITSIHNELLKMHPGAKILEISSKSDNSLGIQLSAFNLQISIGGTVTTVESAFQSSKVFQNGGPYLDLVIQPSYLAKKDPRLRESGPLKCFFLNGLEYVDLTLEFRDGMVVDYTCKNFETEEENKKFIKENLLYNQETLPMGELAIGTNTTAYKMGKVFGIEHLLPILIAEKTGPHIAIGDTCYHMSEENRVYNPDGKEIVAKDNECSILRKTEIEKAYFNCHTDITIPYDELKEISVIKPNGERIVLIEEGRFVLPGTEELNKPLDER